jgi:hypothetical protein
MGDSEMCLVSQQRAYRTQIRLFALLLAATLAAACSTTARLYPVEGPLAAVTPPPVIEALVEGITGNNGRLSWTMPDGATCVGEWSSAAGSQITFVQGSLFSQYGATYGSGFAVGSGGGQNPGRGFAACTDGLRFDVEFVTGAGTASGFGLARDSAGNVYRVLF